MPSRRALWGGAAAIFLAVSALVAVTAGDLGLTWDEPPYRYSQIKMAKWFHDLVRCRSWNQAAPLLSKEGILNGWEYNRFGPNFHPPLAGMLCNVAHGLFGGVMEDLAARRMASGMELAAAAAVLFMFLSRRTSCWAGGVAAVSLVLIPRVFGHSHIAGTDLPLMALWGFTALAFWNGLESLGWRIAFGILLGLSLLVKFTAILIIVPLTAWMIIYRVIPHWSLGRAVVTLVGTAWVAWPLALAGLEIVRLADAIRAQTQLHRMLGPVIEGQAGQSLMNIVGHVPPLTAAELAEAVKAIRSAEPRPGQPTLMLIERELADALEHDPIQGETSAERLRGIMREVREQVLLQSLKHAPPYREAELKRIALVLLEETTAAQGRSVEDLIGHGPPYSAQDLRHVAGVVGRPALALDQYVAYVMPKEDLGVTSGVPGWILFVPLGLWVVWCGVSVLPMAPRRLREASAGLGLWLAGLALAPAVMIALNPTWWHETLPQLGHYYQISVGRQGSLPDIEIFYLGKKYIYSLPWPNGWVLMAVTVPTAILAAALVGIGWAFYRIRRDPLPMFLFLNMVTIPLSRMLPIPAHDGVRLMLPTFFFLAGLAGLGIHVLERSVDRFRSEEYSTVPVLSVIAGFLLIPPAYWLFRSHPYELSYYNGLVAGLPGAQRLGFEPTYWYDAVTPQVIDDLNDQGRGVPMRGVLSLPEPQSIIEATTLPDAAQAALLLGLPGKRINPEVFVELWVTHKLREDIRIPDIRVVPPELSDFPFVALLTHSSKASPFTRILYALEPRRSWGHDGVRLFSLYDPRTVARAWGLWLLLDRTDYTKPVIQPRTDSELVQLARRNYRAVYAAALRVSEEGIDKALTYQDDAEMALVVKKLAERRMYLELLLGRRKEALIEAADILSRAADKRPELLSRLVSDYDGYLPQQALGEYLDQDLVPMSP